MTVIIEYLKSLLRMLMLLFRVHDMWNSKVVGIKCTAEL